jgi:hypothetical protein
MDLIKIWLQVDLLICSNKSNMRHSSYLFCGQFIILMLYNLTMKFSREGMSLMAIKLDMEIGEGTS